MKDSIDVKAGIFAGWQVIIHVANLMYCIILCKGNTCFVREMSKVNKYYISPY